MNEVVVYTKPGCVQCDATKKALQRADISHRSLDVTADTAARDVVRALGYSALPVVVLPDGRHWSGFLPDRIADLVKTKAA
ncbi:glutaredoxin domain-containing protein [Mycobacteroides abscessus]|uniref:glutaredoxin domain-containing protein n=1 Tax=Mycobacteroides abscessus TaxID=36809 RepID=UPI0019D1814B|nr:glutaredoxin domain-containing protein [Mycobacteroides abscessus]MBN7482126.1 NrdH-redoxin [Mycobacteroides abscessus subsp. massiliense]